ncbi:lanC-like protein 3 homolog [Uranotaenia lowii]|uniref:lanC-like protein 3 homolog n=1 Tax=Uranotaenia lowii TaxID=190385 RepID=UPI0024791619|nr:lanC-like protein 3 homolog [Uranotaenia lowii]
MSRFFVNPYDDYDQSKHGNQLSELINYDLVIELVKRCVEVIIRETKLPTHKSRDDLYVGDAGIAFMFWKLNRSPNFRHLFPCLEHATFYIKKAEATNESKTMSKSSSPIGFLCGKIGILSVAAVINYDLNKPNDTAKEITSILKALPVAKTSRYDADEILVGRAGFLSGLYWLNQVMPQKPISNDMIEDVCTALIKRGRSYAHNNRTPLPLMYAYHESDYIGAAHGLCSILHMLLESHWFAKTDGQFRNISASKLSDIKQSIEYFLTLQDSEGNFPTRLQGSNKKIFHRCHGCSGAVYLLAKSYLLFKDDKYLDACRKCAESVWRNGLLYKGPGICHGIAGNGYVFLLMYRLTGEALFLHRASKFAEFLSTEQFNREARQPDRPYSLYEGLAGTVCFLSDLLEPSKAYFPFMDVFEIKYCEK